MSLPEISRRCLSCGAAARAGARFCPQCGKSIVEDAPPTRNSEAPAQWSKPSESQAEWAKPTSEFSAFVRSLGDSGARASTSESAGREAPPQGAAEGVANASTEKEGADVSSAAVQPAAPVTPKADMPATSTADEPVTSTAVPGATPLSTALPVAAEESEERVGRVARVRETTKARVVKARDDARVVLEETPDDSGLRFVVVAVVVFALFLFLLFMSTSMLR
jgi:hypothetical protein